MRGERKGEGLWGWGSGPKVGRMGNGWLWALIAILSETAEMDIYSNRTAKIWSCFLMDVVGPTTAQ
jgi:hypothetical protein